MKECKTKRQRAQCWTATAGDSSSNEAADCGVGSTTTTTVGQANSECLKALTTAPRYWRGVVCSVAARGGAIAEVEEVEGCEIGGFRAQLFQTASTSGSPPLFPAHLFQDPSPRESSLLSCFAAPPSHFTLGSSVLLLCH